MESHEIVEGPIRVKEHGIALRITYNEERDKYRVETSHLLKNGEIEGMWGVFGGSVGYGDSTYDTLEDAREFYQLAQELEGDELLNHFAVGES